MRFASIFALSFIGAVTASPAVISPREDWKISLGWNGETTTPAQLDPSNVVRPTPGRPAVPEALKGGVYFCQGINFDKSTPCLFVSKFTSDQCINFGNDFNDKVSSFGPDSGIKCYLYSNWDCLGSKTIFLFNPGVSDLRAINFEDNTNVNDRASSFKCFAV